MHIHNLWIIAPVYNEQDAIHAFVSEWILVLQASKIPFTFCVIDDGSTDATYERLLLLQKENEALYLIRKENSGHGQTCIFGYRKALESNADYIFQIDSDGQCDARYFSKFVEASAQHPFVFGNRISREDGWQRLLISKCVSLFTFVATGVWLRDANVPYRFMKASWLASIIDQIPSDFYLANILVCLFCEKKKSIHWLPIHFRIRIGGQSSVKHFSFLKQGIILFKQIKKANQNL